MIIVLSFIECFSNSDFKNSEFLSREMSWRGQGRWIETRPLRRISNITTTTSTREMKWIARHGGRICLCWFHGEGEDEHAVSRPSSTEVHRQSQRMTRKHGERNCGIDDLRSRSWRLRCEEEAFWFHNYVCLLSKKRRKVINFRKLWNHFS